MGAESPRIQQDPSRERFLSREDVLAVIPSGIRREITKELTDAHGLYELEVKVKEENGETISYSYTRPWRNPDAVATVERAVGIDKIFSNGFASSWKYRDKHGNWVLAT